VLTASIASVYRHGIVDTGRETQFLFFVSFLLTFGLIRTSTHMIRAQDPADRQADQRDQVEEGDQDRERWWAACGPAPRCRARSMGTPAGPGKLAAKATT